MVSHPLDNTACGQADDVFYCLHPEMAPGGNRQPLDATSDEHRSMRNEWCALYDQILAHNQDGSQSFPSCSDDGHDHHPPDCAHCTEPEDDDDENDDNNDTPGNDTPGGGGSDDDEDDDDDDDPTNPVLPCEKANLVVMVKDMDGVPIEGADVDVSGLGRVVTDANGAADFGEVDPGSYDVIADKDHHGPDRTSAPGSYDLVGVSVPANQTTVVDTIQHEEWDVVFITPGVDPVNAPNDTVGSNDQNEYTYSAATPGVLTMTLRAEITPAGRAADKRERVKFEVEAIPGSDLTWDGAGDGTATTVNGNMVEAVATFTKLPARNRHFGKKTAKLFKDGGEIDTRDYEVFFPRDENNHPNPGQGTTPNWFFYWTEESGIANVRYGGPSGTGDLGTTPAMLNWTYTGALDKTRIIVNDETLTDSPVAGYFGVPLFTGIDSFMATVIHEAHHVTQISNADGLVPGDGCWQNGYSWNQAPDNHWGPGPDGKYGPAPGVVSSAVAASPPFVAGQGDDVTLDSISHWPIAWGAQPAASQGSGAGVHAIEIDAENVCLAAVPADHTFARKDWGDPGKNHKTLNKWDD